MSFLTSLTTKLKSYAWTDNVNAVKDTIIGTVKSRISAALPQISAMSEQSSLSSNCLVELFHFIQDYIPDACFEATEVPIDKDEFSSFEDMDYNRALEFVEALEDYFDAVGESETVDKITTSITNSVGSLYSLALEKREEAEETIYYVRNYFNEVSGQLQDKIEVIELHVNSQLNKAQIAVRNVWHSVKDTWVSLTDMLQSLKENEKINEFISNIINSISSMGDKFTMSESVLPDGWDQFNGVKQMWSIVRRGWNNNGVFGVIGAILYAYDSVSHLTEDADGNLTFTNNNRLMPLSFATGIIKQVLTSAASAISTILTVIGGLVGRVIGLIGSFMSTLIQNINYSFETDTTASLVDSFNVGYPIAPHGFGSHEWGSASGFGDAWVNEGIHSVFNPGGLTVFSHTVNSGVTTCRAEFHPDLVDRRLLLKKYISAIDATSGKRYFNIVWPKDPSQLASDVQQFTPGDVKLVNGSNGNLSDNDDITLREIVLCNILLWVLYRISVDGFSTNTTTDALGRTCYKMGVGFSAYTNLQFRLLDSSNVAHEVVVSSWNGAFSRHLHTLFLIAARMMVTDSDDPTFLDYITTAVSGSSSYMSWVGVANLAIDTASSPSTDTEFTLSPVNQDTGYAFWTYRYHCKANFKDISSNYNVNWGSSLHFDTEPAPVGQFTDFAVKTPKYDASTFWSGLVLTAIGAVLVAATAVTVSLVAKKAIARNNATRAANVENAWGDFLENKDAASFNKYRKAVKKNNFMNKIFGGTDYSVDGLWADTPEQSNSILNNVLSGTSSDPETTILDNTMALREILVGSSS